MKETDSGKYVGKMISGIAWAVGGIIATAWTYEAASDGGVYIVFWGAVVFGAWDFLCGLFGLLGSKL